MISKEEFIDSTKRFNKKMTKAIGSLLKSDCMTPKKNFYCPNNYDHLFYGEQTNPTQLIMSGDQSAKLTFEWPKKTGASSKKSCFKVIENNGFTYTCPPNITGSQELNSLNTCAEVIRLQYRSSCAHLSGYQYLLAHVTCVLQYLVENAGDTSKIDFKNKPYDSFLQYSPLGQLFLNTGDVKFLTANRAKPTVVLENIKVQIGASYKPLFTNTDPKPKIREDIPIFQNTFPMQTFFKTIRDWRKNETTIRGKYKNSGTSQIMETFDEIRKEAYGSILEIAVGFIDLNRSQYHSDILKSVLLHLHKHQEIKKGTTLNHITMLNNASLDCVVDWFTFHCHVMSFALDDSSIESFSEKHNNIDSVVSIDGIKKSVFENMKQKGGGFKGKQKKNNVSGLKKMLQSYCENIWKSGTEVDVSMCAYVSGNILKMNDDDKVLSFEQKSFFKDENFNSITGLSQKVVGIVTQVATLYITSSILSIIQEVGFDNFSKDCHFRSENKEVKSQILVYLFSLFEIPSVTDAVRNSRMKIPMYLYNCVYQNMFQICKEMHLFDEPKKYMEIYAIDLDLMSAGHPPRIVSLQRIKACFYRMICVLHIHFHITYESLKKFITCKDETNGSGLEKKEEKYNPFTSDNSKAMASLHTIDKCLGKAPANTSSKDLLKFTDVDKDSVLNISQWMESHQQSVAGTIEFLLEWTNHQPTPNSQTDMTEKSSDQPCIAVDKKDSSNLDYSEEIPNDLVYKATIEAKKKELKTLQGTCDENSNEFICSYGEHCKINDTKPVTCQTEGCSNKLHSQCSIVFAVFHGKDDSKGNKCKACIEEQFCSIQLKNHGEDNIQVEGTKIGDASNNLEGTKFIQTSDETQHKPVASNIISTLAATAQEEDIETKGKMNERKEVTSSDLKTPGFAVDNSEDFDVTGDCFKKLGPKLARLDLHDESTVASPGPSHIIPEVTTPHTETSGDFQQKNQSVAKIPTLTVGATVTDETSDGLNKMASSESNTPSCVDDPMKNSASVINKKATNDETFNTQPCTLDAVPDQGSSDPQVTSPVTDTSDHTQQNQESVASHIISTAATTATEDIETNDVSITKALDDLQQKQQSVTSTSASSVTATVTDEETRDRLKKMACSGSSTPACADDSNKNVDVNGTTIINNNASNDETLNTQPCTLDAVHAQGSINPQLTTPAMELPDDTQQKQESVEGNIISTAATTVTKDISTNDISITKTPEDSQQKEQSVASTSTLTVTATVTDETSDGLKKMASSESSTPVCADIAIKNVDVNGTSIINKNASNDATLNEHSNFSDDNDNTDGIDSSLKTNSSKEGSSESRSNSPLPVPGSNSVHLEAAILNKKTSDETQPEPHSDKNKRTSAVTATVPDQHIEKSDAMNSNNQIASLDSNKNVPTTATGGLFGAAPAPAPAANTGFGFGAATTPAAPAFGASSATTPNTAGAVSGTAAVPYAATHKTDGSLKIVIHGITAMPCYEYKSFEELRMEDYMQNNRGSRGQTQPGAAGTTPGATSGFGFGAAATLTSQKESKDNEDSQEAQKIPETKQLQTTPNKNCNVLDENGSDANIIEKDEEVSMKTTARRSNRIREMSKKKNECISNNVEDDLSTENEKGGKASNSDKDTDSSSDDTESDDSESEEYISKSHLKASPTLNVNKKSTKRRRQQSTPGKKSSFKGGAAIERTFYPKASKAKNTSRRKTISGTKKKKNIVPKDDKSSATKTRNKNHSKAKKDVAKSNHGKFDKKPEVQKDDLSNDDKSDKNDISSDEGDGESCSESEDHNNNEDSVKASKKCNNDGRVSSDESGEEVSSEPEENKNEDEFVNGRNSNDNESSGEASDESDEGDDEQNSDEGSNIKDSKVKKDVAKSNHGKVNKNPEVQKDNPSHDDKADKKDISSDEGNGESCTESDDHNNEEVSVKLSKNYNNNKRVSCDESGVDVSHKPDENNNENEFVKGTNSNDNESSGEASDEFDEGDDEQNSVKGSNFNHNNKSEHNSVKGSNSNHNNKSVSIDVVKGNDPSKHMSKESKESETNPNSLPPMHVSAPVPGNVIPADTTPTSKISHDTPENQPDANNLTSTSAATTVEKSNKTNNESKSNNEPTPSDTSNDVNNSFEGTRLFSLETDNYSFKKMCMGKNCRSYATYRLEKTCPNSMEPSDECTNVKNSSIETQYFCDDCYSASDHEILLSNLRVDSPFFIPSLLSYKVLDKYGIIDGEEENRFDESQPCHIPYLCNAKKNYLPWEVFFASSSNIEHKNKKGKNKLKDHILKSFNQYFKTECITKNKFLVPMEKTESWMNMSFNKYEHYVNKMWRYQPYDFSNKEKINFCFKTDVETLDIVCPTCSTNVSESMRNHKGIFRNAMVTAKIELQKSKYIHELVSIAALSDLQNFYNPNNQHNLDGKNSLADSLCQFVLDELIRLETLPLSHSLFSQVLHLSKNDMATNKDSINNDNQEGNVMNHCPFSCDSKNVLHLPRKHFCPLNLSSFNHKEEEVGRDGSKPQLSGTCVNVKGMIGISTCRILNYIEKEQLMDSNLVLFRKFCSCDCDHIELNDEETHKAISEMSGISNPNSEYFFSNYPSHYIAKLAAKKCTNLLHHVWYHFFKALFFTRDNHPFHSYHDFLLINDTNSMPNRGEFTITNTNDERVNKFNFFNVDIFDYYISKTRLRMSPYLIKNFAQGIFQKIQPTESEKKIIEATQDFLEFANWHSCNNDCKKSTFEFKHKYGIKSTEYQDWISSITHTLDASDYQLSNEESNNFKSVSLTHAFLKHRFMSSLSPNFRGFLYPSNTLGNEGIILFDGLKRYRYMLTKHILSLKRLEEHKYDPEGFKGKGCVHWDIDVSAHLSKYFIWNNKATYHSDMLVCVPASSSKLQHLDLFVYDTLQRNENIASRITPSDDIFHNYYRQFRTNIEKDFKKLFFDLRTNKVFAINAMKKFEDEFAKTKSLFQDFLSADRAKVLDEHRIKGNSIIDKENFSEEEIQNSKLLFDFEEYLEHYHSAVKSTPKINRKNKKKGTKRKRSISKPEDSETKTEVNVDSIKKKSVDDDDDDEDSDDDDDMFSKRTVKKHKPLDNQNTPFHIEAEDDENNKSDDDSYDEQGNCNNDYDELAIASEDTPSYHASMEEQSDDSSCQFLHDTNSRKENFIDFKLQTIRFGLSTGTKEHVCSKGRKRKKRLRRNSRTGINVVKSTDNSIRKRRKKKKTNTGDVSSIPDTNVITQESEFNDEQGNGIESKLDNPASIKTRLEKNQVEVAEKDKDGCNTSSNTDCVTNNMDIDFDEDKSKEVDVSGTNIDKPTLDKHNVVVDELPGAEKNVEDNMIITSNNAKDVSSHVTLSCSQNDANKNNNSIHDIETSNDHKELGEPSVPIKNQDNIPADVENDKDLNETRIVADGENNEDVDEESLQERNAIINRHNPVSEHMRNAQAMIRENRNRANQFLRDNPKLKGLSPFHNFDNKFLYSFFPTGKDKNCTILNVLANNTPRNDADSATNTSVTSSRNNNRTNNDTARSGELIHDNTESIEPSNRNENSRTNLCLLDDNGINPSDKALNVSCVPVIYGSSLSANSINNSFESVGRQNKYPLRWRCKNIKLNYVPPFNRNNMRFARQGSVITSSETVDVPLMVYRHDGRGWVTEYPSVSNTNQGNIDIGPGFTIPSDSPWNKKIPKVPPELLTHQGSNTPEAKDSKTLSPCDSSVLPKPNTHSVEGCNPNKETNVLEQNEVAENKSNQDKNKYSQIQDLKTLYLQEMENKMNDSDKYKHCCFRITPDEQGAKRKIHCTSWLHLYDFFKNDHVKTNQYWLHLVDSKNPVCPLCYKDYQNKKNVSCKHNLWIKQGAEKYFLKLTLVRYSIMLLNLNKTSRYKNIITSFTESEKKEIINKSTMLSRSIWILLQLTNSQIFGTDEERKMFDDHNDASEVYIHLMQSIEAVCGKAEVLHICQHMIKTNRQCIRKRCRNKTSEYMYNYEMRFTIEDQEKYVTYKVKPLCLKQCDSLKLFLQRHSKTVLIEAKCGFDGCKSGTRKETRALETVPNMMWISLGRHVMEFPKKGSKEEAYEVFLVTEIKPNWILTFSKINYRLRSIICYEKSHYYTYTSVFTPENKWIWLYISDDVVEVIDDDLIKRSDIVTGGVYFLYEKFDEKKNAITYENGYDLTSNELSPEEKKSRECSIKRFKKNLTMSAEIRNESVFCFFNSTFQALSFLDFSEKFQKEMHIQEEMYNEDGLMYILSDFKHTHFGEKKSETVSQFSYHGNTTV